MSLLDSISQPEVWEKFYDYKTSLACPKDIERQLRGFLDVQGYLPITGEFQASENSPFPLPKKKIISKQSSHKKRVVYTYPNAENMVLKLLTYLMLRKYDSLFSDNLYSFRPGRSASDAIRRLQKIPGLSEKYTYKVDVSNYFNSIPIPCLLPKLKSALEDDPALYRFLASLLTEPRVIWEGDAGDTHVITEEKGIMAGTPQACFYANLYLAEMDKWFYDHHIPYARYSDDVIVFGDSMEEVQGYAETIRDFLAKAGLSVNPSKEEFRTPQDGFIFLGFFLQNGKVDVSPVSVAKIKAKMRRKARSLTRWQNRNDLAGEKAAKAFVRIFNRKLLESSVDSDLTWSYWYFSTINTTESLHVIDLYAQDCLRTLITGKHTKARYNARYEDLKALGYQSLVHAYYAFAKENKT
ncbi:MAG: group II intron reverse transcriptase domain-containing protein [Lachnospiraceae bacterium]|nr:group II intron reverse transcriptase domain-containing protein [Lachnospiraceae bacterium]